jgi:hypothetical protein
MVTVATGPELVDLIEGSGRRLHAAQKVMLRAGVKAGAEHMKPVVSRVVGGDFVVSQVGRFGARVGVKTRVDRVGLVSVRGPVHLVDNPTSPRGGHPGTVGKRLWSAAEAGSMEAATAAMYPVVVAAIEGG